MLFKTIDKPSIYKLQSITDRIFYRQWTVTSMSYC